VGLITDDSEKDLLGRSNAERGYVLIINSAFGANGAVHEAAHLLEGDMRFISESAEWDAALKTDDCTASAYGTTSKREAYAEDMCIFLYKLWRGSNPVTGTTCMDAQLAALALEAPPPMIEYISGVPTVPT
jgi:hypothetical protein